MSQRDATPKQIEKLRTIRRDFGHATVRKYRVDARTGVMRVEVTCQAYIWSWWFDTDGNMVDRALTSPLPLDGDANTPAGGGENTPPARHPPSAESMRDLPA